MSVSFNVNSNLFPCFIWMLRDKKHVVILMLSINTSEIVNVLGGGGPRNFQSVCVCVGGGGGG